MREHLRHCAPPAFLPVVLVVALVLTVQDQLPITRICSGELAYP